MTSKRIRTARGQTCPTAEKAGGAMTKKTTKPARGKTCLTAKKRGIAIAPKKARTAPGKTSPTVVMVNPYLLKPSPENAIYDKVTADDPEVQKLAADIRKNGVLNPLVVSRDGFIISGHRRREAAILAGLKAVPVIYSEVERGGDEFDQASAEFVRLLVSHNVQRVKSRPEMLREAMAQVDTETAYQEIEQYRWKQSQIDMPTVEADARGRRKQISAQKEEMARAAIRIVQENKKFWPLSDRQIHYRLLNEPPLRNSTNPESRFRNDQTSYKDLCNLLTRLRLDHRIPMYAIADPTRPSTVWKAHPNIQAFIQQELESLFLNYRRNLLQSQPLYVEVVAEKLTVQSILQPVCSRYHLPLTICRGYPSLPARAEIVNRFKASGKDRLVLLALSDFDPEGVNIVESLLQSLKSDFYLSNATIVRVGLNQEHVERFQLADNPAEAKAGSSRCRDFVKRHGKHVYELEALTPDQLQTILSEAIETILNAEAFESEVQAEKADSRFIAGVRLRVCQAVREILSSEDPGNG